MAKKTKTPAPPKNLKTVKSIAERIVARLFRGRVQPQVCVDWLDFLEKVLTFKYAECGATPEDIDELYRQMKTVGFPLTRGDVKRIAKLERQKGRNA